MRKLIAMTAWVACLAPAALLAQGSEQSARRDSSQAEAAHQRGQAPAPAAEKPQRKSAMNMVMAMLIHAAEQQASQRHAGAPPGALAAPSKTDPTQPVAPLDAAAAAARAPVEQERVALQSEGSP